jgi:hypothetical protein
MSHCVKICELHNYSVTSQLFFEKTLKYLEERTSYSEIVTKGARHREYEVNVAKCLII